MDHILLSRLRQKDVMSVENHHFFSWSNSNYTKEFEEKLREKY